MGPKLLTLARVVALLLPIFLVFSAGPIVSFDSTSHISQYGLSVWRVQDGYLRAKPRAIAQATEGHIWSELTLDYFGLMVCSLCAGMHSPGGVTPHALLAARDGSQSTKRVSAIAGIER